ncbi:MAG: hypothetical protein PVH00_04150 [Gemmatimonadota bacterium]|jgi:hypothetical protein
MKIPAAIRRTYTSLATIGFPALLVVAATVRHGASPQESGEITVQRINVVEPDGTLKMVISNSALMHPGVIGGDTLMPGRVRPAGITFFDDRGDEMGGVGLTGNDEHRWGGLLFDQINNDETLRLTTQQAFRNGEFLHQAGLSITDRNPEYDLTRVLAFMQEVEAITDPATKQARIKELEAMGVFQGDRMFVGREGTGDVLVDLRDGKGRPRLRMLVEAGGAARIEFLDESGTVVRTLDGS